MRNRTPQCKQLPIIEFIGAMGCGKTTLFNQLSNDLRRKRLAGLLPLQELQQIYHEPILKRDRPLAYVLSQLDLSGKLQRGLLKKRTKALGYRMLNHLDPETQYFLDLVLFGRSQYTGPVAHALDRVAYFRNSVLLFLFLKHAVEEKQTGVLIDEGLMHRGTSMAFWLQNQDHFVEKYCKALPYLPRTVIHVHTDRTIAIDRLKRRRLDLAKHIATHDAAVSMSEYFAHFIQSNGGHVICVDGANPPSVNAAECLAKIREIVSDDREMTGKCSLTAP